MTQIDDIAPLGARALSGLAAGRVGPNRLQRILSGWATWRQRRADAAAVRDLPREIARDIGLEDWRSRRSSAAYGPLPWIGRG